MSQSVLTLALLRSRWGVVASRLAPFLFFIVVAFLLWITFSDRWVMCNDEGIYLEGALRVLEGRAPYKDFFALTGPGTFWLQALVFKIFGVIFQSGRVLPVLDVALLATCILLLVRRLASTGLGAFAGACFAVYAAAFPGMITVNHRWDSAALATLSLTAIIGAGNRIPKGGVALIAFLGGMFGAAAAWCTPTMLLVVVVLGGWLLWRGPERRQAIVFAGGASLMSAIAVAWLATKGALRPMAEHLLWTASHYGSGNRFPYGGIVGGWDNVARQAGAPALVYLIPLLL